MAVRLSYARQLVPTSKCHVSEYLKYEKGSILHTCFRYRRFVNKVDGCIYLALHIGLLRGAQQSVKIERWCRSYTTSWQFSIQIPLYLRYHSILSTPAVVKSGSQPPKLTKISVTIVMKYSNDFLHKNMLFLERTQYWPLLQNYHNITLRFYIVPFFAIDSSFQEILSQ